jgi:hypothetical protein
MSFYVSKVRIVDTKAQDEKNGYLVVVIHGDMNNGEAW